MIIIGIPYSVAICAALILVIIPPVPRAVPAPPAQARTSSVISSTLSIKTASSNFLGSLLYKPSMSLKFIIISASQATQRKQKEYRFHQSEALRKKLSRFR